MENQNGHRDREQRWLRAAIIALAIVLAVLVVFLFFQYRALRRENLLNARSWRWTPFLGSRAPLPVVDASAIRAWMTFGYVNHLFALPPAYLKAKLGIVDARYPNLTVSAYASEAGIAPDAALAAVQGAVQDLAAPTTTAP